MSKVYDNILFASCWEDPSLDREAFQIGPSSIVFTITTGGCNAFAFLLDDPKEVIALDINPHQNYLFELKISAFRKLNYSRMLAFFGVRPSSDRLATYRKDLRESLSPEARTFWDANPQAIKSGIIHCGRWERYLRLLRKAFNLIIGGRKIRGIFELGDAEKRKTYYQSQWVTLRWKFFVSIFLSKRVMSFLFTKDFFAQLDTNFSFGKHFEGRIRFGLTELPPPKTNSFISYMMLGSYIDPTAMPIYLREENFEIIRARLNRITIISESCENYFARLPENRISHFNFTNIFEWMPATNFEELLKETIRVAMPGATLTYRNLLVPRSRPESLADRIHPDTAQAAKLAARDLSFVYKNYRVEHVIKN